MENKITVYTDGAVSCNGSKEKKAKEILKMTKQEIEQRIDELENQIFMEEMKDSGYDSHYVYIRQAEIKKLKKMLEEMGD